MSAKGKSRPKDKGRSSDEARDALVAASLSHVAFDGWTEKAFSAGAADAGVGASGFARLFPGGLREATLHLGAYADRLMTENLGRGWDRGLRTHERVAAALKARFEALAPHREAVRRMLAFLALPGNAGLAAKLSWRAADAVWRAAGDASTDFNYYTKRATLAGIYAPTLLCWLGDDSEDFVETWAFLDRRLAELMGFFAWRGRAKGVWQGLSAARTLGGIVRRFAPRGTSFGKPFPGRM